MKNSLALTFRGVILFVFILLSSSLSAQKSKSHYLLHNPDPAIPAAVYEEAINKKNFEEFRYVDARRTIKFSGSSASIELFSAKELLELYGKAIHPMNIKYPASAASIEFILYPEHKAIKEKLLK
jgi:hypothetical protein